MKGKATLLFELHKKCFKSQGRDEKLNDLKTNVLNAIRFSNDNEMLSIQLLLFQIDFFAFSLKQFNIKIM